MIAYCTKCNMDPFDVEDSTNFIRRLWCPICGEGTIWKPLKRESKQSKSRIPDLIETLDKMKELHLSKNADYATDENPFHNFDFTEKVMKEFTNERDKVFIWPIACKLARLANLLSTKRAPNNESIDDSFVDIAVYILLWKADVLRRTKVS